MTEIVRLEIDPAQTVATIRDQAEAGSEIWIGEGRDKIVIRARAKRGCGGCSFCCTAAGINALEKPPMVRCRHLAGRGCGNYKDRPQTCRDFACAWLIGNFPDHCRPDKIGAYVAFFATEERGFYAVVNAVSARLHRRRFHQMIRTLGYLPEIRIIYDDTEGVILRHGQRPQRFRMLPRPPGDFETAHYLVEGAA